ncbi:MAG: rhodanese-like domain-containing protein [Syntrophaceae bacterium]|nr:rhodanese-like domain-containing protein [Syntrophaceae bacterium]
MTRKPVLFLFLFYLLSAMSVAYSWGPEDESWRRQQQQYREQTKGAKRISAAQAFSLYSSGKTVLISVDGKEYYKERHILGSINIPFEKLEKSRLKLPKETLLLLFCR